MTWLFCVSVHQPGDSVMVPPSMSEAEASVLFPAGVFTKEVPSKRKYLRYTPQPGGAPAPLHTQEEAPTHIP